MKRLLTMSLVCAWACTDVPTVPAARTDTLSARDFALMLRGDPFLLRTAEALGRPELASWFDQAALSFDDPAGTTAPLIPVFGSALQNAASAEGDSTAVSADDAILSATLQLVADRLAQSADAGSMNLSTHTQDTARRAAP